MKIKTDLLLGKIYGCVYILEAISIWSEIIGLSLLYVNSLRTGF